MKYEKQFYLISAAIFVLTTADLALLTAGSFGRVHMSPLLWILALICMAFLSLGSFACGCILQSLYTERKENKTHG